MKLGNRKYLSIYALFAFINAVIGGVSLVKFGDLTNLALTKDFAGMIQAGIIVGILGLVQMMVWEIRNRTIKNYIKFSMISLKEDYVGRILKRHKLSFNHAQYVSHLTNDADRLEYQHYLNVIELVGLVMSVVVAAVILARISWVFIGVIVILSLIFFFLARKTSKPVEKQEKVKSKELERYTHFIEETLDGFSVIKSHQYEHKRSEQFESLIDALRKRQFQLEKKLSFIEAFNTIVQGLIIATLAVVGMSIAKQAGMGIGETMVIVLVFSDVLWPLQRFTPLITEMSGIQTVFEDFDRVLDDAENSGSKKVTPFESIQFQNTNLGYDVSVVEGVDLEILRDEKVLIVGPSGAGKSTLLKTILRDIEPLSGTVSMNSTVLNHYDLKSYYNTFSIVEQIGFIFSGTIQENISMLEDKDVSELLDLVSLGYLDQKEVLKNNGDTLSGGERARILLARSHYFDKEVIVCDEILSSLDARIARVMERDILNNSKTLINVSHIVFRDNLELYDKFVIVEAGKVKVTNDPKYVLERMLESDVVFG